MATDLVPCRVCQHQVAQDAKTCPSCGTSLPWKSQARIDAEAVSRKTDARRLKAGCLITLAAVIGLFLIAALLDSQMGGGGLSRERCERRRQNVGERLVS